MQEQQHQRRRRRRCCCSSGSWRLRLAQQQQLLSPAALLLLLSAAAAMAQTAAAAAPGVIGLRQQQLASSSSSTLIGRRLLIRPMPTGAGTCRNTRQGPAFMADDTGRLCAANELDWGSGCCGGGGAKRHACDACDTRDGCCEGFEQCVSCCMAPANKPDERLKVTPRRPNDKASGLWADAFELCASLCRTHSFSTSHENAYIGARHHCYSRLGKPMLSPPLPPGALDGVTVLVSAAGASCDAACEAHGGRACSQAHLHHLNSCDRLREQLDCEAGCAEEAMAPAMPAAVDPEAPKAARPALCLVAKPPPAEGAAAFTCGATANHMRRLCACRAAAADKQPAEGETKKKEGDAAAAAPADGGGAAPAAAAAAAATPDGG